MTIGERLKEARHKKGLTLKEIQAELRIRTTYLEAMENDRFEVIPGEAYRRAFLRTYATFLGLNADEIIKEYETVHGKQQQQAQAHRDSSWTGFALKALAVVAAILVIGLAVYLALPEKSPKPELPQAPLEVKKEGVPSEKSETTKAPEKEEAKAIPSVFKFRVEVLDSNCWIEIKNPTEGKILVSRTLMPGESFEATSSTTLTATIGFPRAVKIYFNESEVTDLPKQGVLKISVDSRGVSLR